ncbi:DUF4012 domain-containing protein [Xylanimonas allomyrinae]|uniref:DUF4012 domain-containing protein n=1 Tax=Xylanimonas allomyrinae TaxID=2509459 RepID=A0A4P6ENP6_9MICO|nr:DUF4012 domain-containing protein [Xylanimonas allomyrinae]QAY63353.1 DUF4012 domain-containing protein [Xylanimonas allomyrinae]
MAHDGWGDGWSDVAVGRAPRRPLAETAEFRRTRRRRRLWVVSGIVAVVIGVAAYGAWLASDVLRARDALDQVAAAVPGLERQLREDPQAAEAALADVQRSAHTASAATHGPQWTLASALPWVGDDARALGTLSTSVDHLVTDVLPRLSAAAEAVRPDAVTPRDGRLDLAPLIAVRDDVVSADTTVKGELDAVSSLDRDGLMGPLAQATAQVEDQLRSVHSVTATAARAAVLLPAMLGADGPRDWLVIAQNNAEPRATGGIPGAILHVRADDGRLTVVEHVAAGSLGPFDQPVLALDDSEEALFGTQLGRWSQDVTLTPDFPRAATLLQAMWTSAGHPDVSGVLSVDPVLLQSLLAASAPVSFTDPDGESVTLDGTNTAQYLMADVYAAFPDPAEQDAVFGLASEAVLTQFQTGTSDGGALIDALAEGARQGRLTVWSADPQEQKLVHGTVLSGELRGVVPVGETNAPLVGVYLNMTTAGKTGYYLSTEAEVTDAAPLDNAAQALTVRVRLTNRLSPAQAAHLPAYVLGDGPSDGTVRVNVLVYAPASGAVDSVTLVADGSTGVFAQEQDGLDVGARTVTIAPGQTQELEVRLRTGPGQPLTPHLRVTPGVLQGTAP